MPELKIRRRVTEIEYYGFKGRSAKLFLECGHDTYRKASQLPLSRVICHDCTHLAKGGKITRIPCLS